MSSSRFNITLPEQKTTFHVGDAVCVIDAHGNIVNTGILESFERHDWEHYAVSLNGQHHLIQRGRDAHAEQYLVHQAALRDCAPAIHHHLLDVASIAFPGIMRADILSTEQHAHIAELIETLHAELLTAASQHPELYSRFKMMARAHGHYVVEREALEQNRTLQIAKAVKRTY